MASPYGRVSVAPKILILLLLIIVLILGGLLWFDILGVLNAKQTLTPVLRMAGLSTQQYDVYSDDPQLLQKELLAKEKEALRLKEEDLVERESQIEGELSSLQDLRQQLEKKQGELEEIEKALNQRLQQYDDKRKNLEQNARYLTGMEPNSATSILLAMEDQDVVDLLRIVEEQAAATGEASIVGFWLSLMPEQRAADIQRKMTLKPME